MMHFPKVAVVILNWNGKRYLEKFLPSVLASSYPNLEIVVGDNASTDQSLIFIRTTYPSIRIISNSKNLGFAGGYNEVLRQVDGDYYVLLNSDVEVTEHWLEPVIELMETDGSIVAAQPKILSYNNKSEFEYAGAAGGFLDRFGYAFCRGRLFDAVEKDKGQYNQATEIFWASGAAFFIRKAVWDESGGFDADFFAHMEEIDLCWRLKNKGFKIMYCPASQVYHVGGGTLSAESAYKTYLNFRNYLVMLQKNLPAAKSFRIIFIRFWLDLLSLLKYLFQGNVKNALAISKAHFYFFGNLNGNRKKNHTDKSRFNAAGLYRGSVVWDFFGRGIKRFSDLKF